MIEPIAVTLAIIGAYLVGSWEMYWRFYGFLLWCVSNSLWAIHGITISDWWIAIQFVVFLGLSIRGIKNNMAGVPWACRGF